MKKASTWTKAEEDSLRTNYGIMSAPEIGKSIERTTQAIYDRASKMGLYKPRKIVGVADSKELRCCRYCVQEKPLGDFCIYRGNYSWKCRQCQNVETTLWRQANPDKCKLHGIKYKYGIDSAQALEEIIGNGKCAICGGVGEQIDHDHTTNLVRGYLCKQCNRGLGHFRDSIEIMMLAIKYLEKV